MIEYELVKAHDDKELSAEDRIAQLMATDKWKTLSLDQKRAVLRVASESGTRKPSPTLQEQPLTEMPASQGKAGVPSDQFKFDYPPGRTGRQFEPAGAGTSNPQRPAYRMSPDHPDYEHSIYGRVGPSTSSYMAGGPPRGDITSRELNVRQSAARRGKSAGESAAMDIRASLDDEPDPPKEQSTKERLTEEEILQMLRDIGGGGDAPPDEPPTADGFDEPDGEDWKSNGHGDPTTGEMDELLRGGKWKDVKLPEDTPPPEDAPPNVTKMEMFKAFMGR